MRVGVFDSGLGGLTVAAAIREAIPDASLIYLGDTARVPYGTRSPETVLRYARACASHLAAHDIQVLVIACNTVSAVAVDMLRVELDLPVLGVIHPGARAGAAATKSGRLGVLATRGTVQSGAYPRAVASVSSRLEVVARAAPLLVPLAEEGWLEGPVPEQVVARYVAAFDGTDVDTIVLGCTHYPLFADLIRRTARGLLGASLEVVDSAHATAAELVTLRDERAALGASEGDGSLQVMVTDRPARFGEVASRFLGAALDPGSVVQVDL